MGSEMCIRDRLQHPDLALDIDEWRLLRAAHNPSTGLDADRETVFKSCLLYTSDAADERSSVDLGGRRIIKKKKHIRTVGRGTQVIRNRKQK